MTWRTEMYRALDERLAKIAGGKTATALAKMGLNTVGDLMRHIPRRYIVGTEMSSFASLMVDDEVALVARIASVSHHYGAAKQRLNVELTDGRGGRVTSAFFADRDHLIKHWQKVLQVGRRGIFIGKISQFNRTLQLSHPDFVILDDQNRVIAGRVAERDAISRATQRDALVGIYPSVKGVPTWVIADTAALALPHLEGIEDPYPEWVLDGADVLGLFDAFQAIHAPQSLEEAEAGITRLRFDEAFTTQVALAYRRAERLAQQVPTIVPVEDGLLADFDAQLPFTLTAGQQEVSSEIFADLARPTPMNRLLQGEVGSGKTVLALRAMLAAVDAGAQAALLAPTEVLARQHHRTILSLLGELGFAIGGCHVVLHTGARGAAARKDTLDAIASGAANIVIGTHALLSEDVVFANLGLVVVDEQHRFGVEQRAALGTRAQTPPHTLIMTATPIPRSVAMTVFGDLAVSELRELPGGRAPVKTVFVNTTQHPHWVQRAWQRVHEEVAAGRQAFVVCSRIDAEDAESPDPSLEEVAATRSLHGVLALAEQLATGPLHGLRVGLAHGRQSAAERDETMQAFAAGHLDVLVATTVIEVGIDVPNASMMVIMDADRFGLAQLHQLRGRIGRGEHEGLCLLLAPLSDQETVASQRLQALVESRDGFALAETDLRLRREGDVLGAEQSGGSSLKLLRVLDDQDLIEHTKQLAEKVVTADPQASEPWVADLLHQVEVAAEWAAKS